MKSQTRFSIFVFLLLFSFQSNAQWTASTGLDGMAVYDIEIFDSTIFICGYGVYQKPVGGGSWIKNNPFHGISNIEYTDSVMFGIGGTFAYLSFFRSFNSGQTWEEIWDGSSSITHLATIKNSVIVDDDDSIFLSNDNGDSWEFIGNGLPPLELSYICAFDTILFVGDNSSDSIFRSDNLGQTWMPITRLGLPEYFHNEINCIVEFNDSIWAATREGIFVSGGNEIGWLSRNNGISIQKITDLEISNDTLFCSNDSGIFYLDQGVWNLDIEGLETLNVSCLEWSNGIQYSGTSCGPFQRQGKEDWHPIYQGLNHLNVNYIASYGPDIWVCTIKGLYKSSNKGVDFEYLENEEFSSCNQLVITDSLYYLNTPDNGLFISRDSAQSWTNISGELIGYHGFALGSEYVYYQASGIRRANHGSCNWELIPNWIGEANVWELAARDNIVLVSVYMDSTYTSIDNGNTFIGSILEIDAVTIWENQFYAPNYHYLNISGDGLNWESYPYPEDWWTYTIAVNSEAILIGGKKTVNTWTDSLLLGLSYDGGVTWNEITDNLPGSNIWWPTMSDVHLFDDRIFASPSRYGLWYRDGLLVGEKELNEVEPGEILLYPNPVKGLLTVDASDSFKGSVQLKIYDINGRIVKQQKLSSLKSSIEFTGLKPGIYFLQFVGDGKTVTQKIVKQ